jgi:TetR/AcrR family transcriptional regulator, transcriptional repressor for nem operon
MIAIIFVKMRQSKEEKAKTHERILDVASRQIREQGMDAPAVAEIMQAAGLTHGGFYKHFDSRDDLIAEATDRALTHSDRFVHELTDDAEDPLGAFVDWYLSAQHRDAPGAGCAVAALGGDVGRGDERVRAAYGRQVERYFAYVQGFLGEGEDARERAIVAFSALVGAVVLARGVDDEALSGEILRAVSEGISELR